MSRWIFKIAMLSVEELWGRVLVVVIVCTPTLQKEENHTEDIW